jgi:hypothetical protein
MYHGSRAEVPGTARRTELERLIGGPPVQGGYVLMRGVDRACDPGLYEPNLGINLEVSDLISGKKGNL